MVLWGPARPVELQDGDELGRCGVNLLSKKLTVTHFFVDNKGCQPPSQTMVCSCWRAVSRKNSPWQTKDSKDMV